MIRILTMLLFLSYFSYGQNGNQMFFQLLKHGSVGPLLLDSFTSASSAFSLRLLRSSYSGNCIKVRRSSDNTTQNIGFVSNYLDTASLTTFVGANSGFIDTWYDQSGNARDATQATAANQPRIINAGVYDQTNTKPTVNFGTNLDQWWLTLATGYLNAATALGYFMVSKITDYTLSNSGVFGPVSTNSVGLEILQVTVLSRRTFLRVNNVVRNDNTGAAYQLWTDATQSLTSIHGNASAMSAYKNSSAVTFTSSVAMPSLNFNGQYAIGRYAAAATNMYGDIQELVIYSLDKTASRSAIEAHINRYYAIF